MVNSIADNDVNEAVDQMKDALDEKIFRKVEPYMKLSEVETLRSRSLGINSCIHYESDDEHL